MRRGAAAMTASAFTLVSAAAVSLFAAAGAAPSTVITTLAVVRADRGEAVPGPIVLTGQRRGNPDGDRALLRLSIDPPPMQLPRVTFTIEGDPGITLTTLQPSIARDAPEASAGQAYVVGSKIGHAIVTAHVGAPYNTAVSADVFRYGTVELRCYSPGEAISLAVDARGNPIQSSGPDDSDVYLALPPAAADGFFCRGYKTFADPQLSEPMIRFPAGAVSANVPESAFNTISARDWRNAVTEIPERAAGGVWLIRSRSGSTIKLVRHGPFAAAPAGGDFADRIQTVAPVVRIPVRLPPPPAHVRATVATDAGGTLFAPYGAGPGHPLLIGIPPRAGYTATLFGGSVAATVTPLPYTAPEPSWSLKGPLQTRGSYGGKLLVVGTQPGIGRVTATFDEPAHATASLRVIVYPTLAIGCGDIANGYGVAFDDDGTARVVGTPDEADLFASYDAHAFRCGGLVAAPGAMTRPPTPFTPGAPDTPASHADDDAGWYFPYGGVFFPNGNDPARSPPFGSPRGVAFDAVTAAHWRNDRTSERLAQYQADTFPCMRTQGSIGYSIPNCTTMPDGVLLIRTRRGRYVKLLWMGRGPGSFAGLYQVSRPDGTFAY